MVTLSKHHDREDSPLSPASDNKPSPSGPKIVKVAEGALKVVSWLRAQDTRAERIDQVISAISSTDSTAWRTMAEAMLDEGVPATDLVDIYIPEAARTLGAGWVNDTTGFSDVTLGCARLAQLFRWAETRIPEGDQIPPLDHGQICLVSADGGQHSLGLMVLASQLRRRGISVATQPDGTLPETADVVMISASGQEDLDTLRTLVRRARNLETNPRVLLGGAAVILAPDRCHAAGADTVTLDLDIAVTHCLRNAPDPAPDTGPRT